LRALALDAGLVDSGGNALFGAAVNVGLKLVADERPCLLDRRLLTRGQPLPLGAERALENRAMILLGRASGRARGVLKRFRVLAIDTSALEGDRVLDRLRLLLGSFVSVSVSRELRLSRGGLAATHDSAKTLNLGLEQPDLFVECLCFGDGGIPLGVSDDAGFKDGGLGLLVCARKRDLGRRHRRLELDGSTLSATKLLLEFSKPQVERGGVAPIGPGLEVALPVDGGAHRPQLATHRRETLISLIGDSPEPLGLGPERLRFERSGMGGREAIAEPLGFVTVQRPLKFLGENRLDSREPTELRGQAAVLGRERRNPFLSQLQLGAQVVVAAAAGLDRRHLSLGRVIVEARDVVAGGRRPARDMTLDLVEEAVFFGGGGDEAVHPCLPCLDKRRGASWLVDEDERCVRCTLTRSHHQLGRREVDEVEFQNDQDEAPRVESAHRVDTGAGDLGRIPAPLEHLVERHDSGADEQYPMSLSSVVGLHRGQHRIGSSEIESRRRSSGYLCKTISHNQEPSPMATRATAPRHIGKGPCQVETALLRCRVLFSSLPDRVRITEVGPRDGLQNESVVVDTRTKIALLVDLVDAGLQQIEATAFVNPRWIPPLADHAEVARATRQAPLVGRARYSALTPNVKGYEGARAAGIDQVAIFLAASESHNRKNINATTGEALARYAEVTDRARADGVPVRGYVSCVMGCPYEGAIAPAAVVAVAEKLLAMGCEEISLGDTIGVGNPKQTVELVRAVKSSIDIDRIALHLHDTRGTALANITASLEEGVRSFDSAVGGLGGCPYAPGASGNVATEDLVSMLHGMGVRTGIDLDSLVRTSLRMEQVLGRTMPSRVVAAMRAAAGAHDVERVTP
jgi:hydroxymethylglutaryl-CoA lyase